MTIETRRSAKFSLALVGCFMVLTSGLLEGCSSPKPPPPPPKPSRLPDAPEVRDVSLVRPETLRVGDTIAIVLDAVGGQIPISWTFFDIPRSWKRTTSNNGRFYLLSGRIPMGTSDDGLAISMYIIDSNNRRSRSLPIKINVIAREYEFQPTPTGKSPDELSQSFTLRLRSLPDWDPENSGRIEIVADTSGLNPGDTIRLWDPNSPGIDIIQTIGGEEPTRGRRDDPGEVFLLTSSSQRDALENDTLALTVRSAANPDFRITRLKIKVY